MMRRLVNIGGQKISVSVEGHGSPAVVICTAVGEIRTRVVEEGEVTYW